MKFNFTEIEVMAIQKAIALLMEHDYDELKKLNDENDPDFIQEAVLQTEIETIPEIQRKIKKVLKKVLGRPADRELDFISLKRLSERLIAIKDKKRQGLLDDTAIEALYAKLKDILEPDEPTGSPDMTKAENYL